MIKYKILITAAILLVSGWAEAQENNVPVKSEQAGFKIVPVAQGLDHPWSLAFLPDGDYLVSERRGKLWRLSSNGQKREIQNVPEFEEHSQYLLRCWQITKQIILLTEPTLKLIAEIKDRPDLFNRPDIKVLDYDKTLDIEGNKITLFDSIVRKCLTFFCYKIFQSC